MSKILLLLLFCVIALISCNKQEPQLSGHWISKEYFQDREFRTIDFEKEVETSLNSGLDTVNYYINLNKNSFSTNGEHRAFLVKGDNDYEFYTPHHESKMRLWFDQDTMYIRGSDYRYYDGNYFKVDDKNIVYEELFNGTNLNANLPSTDELDDTHNIKQPLIANINIGRGRFDPVDFDSIRINVQDVYIDLLDIPYFVSQAKDRIAESQMQDFVIAINSDSSVEKSFIKKVINQINNADSAIRIYKSYFNYSNNQIAYKRVK
jgi:hypothetical protein